MIRQVSTLADPADGRMPHTIWGLDPVQLHDRYWAARGVQVVRLGERVPLEINPDLYLLTDADPLLLFPLGRFIETLHWLKPRLLLVRVHDVAEHQYAENVVADDEDRFVRVERHYGRRQARFVERVALTTDVNLAQLWQEHDDARTAWRDLRRQVSEIDRVTSSVRGSVYDRSSDDDLRRFVRELVGAWHRPDINVRRALPVPGSEGAWADLDAPAIEQTRFVGPVWIGAGRRVDGAVSVVGPAVLWDDPEHRPAADTLNWAEMKPADLEPAHLHVRRLTSLQRAGKRLFDLGFAVIALALTLPIYPLVMLAILIEDGRPFFFAHRRESAGGREFPCLKFRSMRKDAERIKQEMTSENQVDGPQFYIDHDPRHTRVGRVIRKLQIDELPQFLNVLVGHMSIVGPRPSPYAENQFCPAWRDARLSVRPGVTGLWQVMRTREKDIDFQEWIRYDIQYVENMTFWLDVKIIFTTILQALGFRKRRWGRV